MKKWLVLLAMLFSPTASQGTDLSDWKILEMRETYLEYGYYTWAVEPFLAPTFRPTQKFDLAVNLDLFNRIMFMDNTIHSETDQYQYRKIGWHYKLGIHLGDSADVFFEHFSQHLLDTTPQMPQTFDMVGIRVWFYKRDR